ncbi:hypothetical protein [Halococcus sediminicola]|uniref:hypothetical protein n=1 Tax=Halococcus sediminicola TaxID=1264579 RepID=UPI000678DE82|nr:hypothetical protein [Halococcus sediminicola]
MSCVRENYCTECEWSVSSGDHPVPERTQLAIEHAVTTGHDIDCILDTEEPSTDAFAVDSAEQSVD